MFYDLILEVACIYLPYSVGHTDKLVQHERVLQMCADTSKLESLWAILEADYQNWLSC